MKPYPHLAAADARVVELHTEDSLQRTEVEQFIREVYAERFGARLGVLMPVLAALSDGNRGVQAAAGLRPAVLGPLFVEQYLDASIEQVVESTTGHRVARSRIIEVGNLATRLPGIARVLFVALTQCLYERGFDWVVFAGTTDVRAIFRRMGIELVSLGPADPNRLGDARRDWGSYYDNQPVVMAGSIAAGCRALGLERAPLSLLTALGQLPGRTVPCAG